MSSVAGTKLDVDVSDASPRAVVRDAADIEGRVLDTIVVHAPDDRSISHEGLALLMDHENALMGMIDTIPESEDGTIPGVRLVGIRPGSVVSKLGFENGDRVDAVNGRSVTVAVAVEVYTNLRAMTRLDVDVSRNGTARKIVVRVR